jgi:hypothetical protein
MFTNFKHALREVMSEPGGQLSWGRVASSIALLAAIAWVSRIIYLSHGIPSLDGITTFVLAPYGTNKAITAVQAYSSNPVNPSTPKQQ